MATNFPPCPTFWRNYQFCLNWARIYHATFWESTALSLMVENETLRSVIRETSSSDTGYVFDSQNATNGCGKIYPPPSNPLDDGTFYEAPNEGETEIPEDSFQFVVDDGMMQFLEQSMRHKEALRKEKMEKTNVSAESKNRRRRHRVSSESGEDKGMVCDMAMPSNQLKLGDLYGKKVGRIAGMETAVELNFQKAVSLCQPVLWPVIELNT